MFYVGNQCVYSLTELCNHWFNFFLTYELSGAGDTIGGGIHGIHGSIKQNAPMSQALHRGFLLNISWTRAISKISLKQKYSKINV